jgi:hypothetical protein
MSRWGAAKARQVLAALLRIGWTVTEQEGSHRRLERAGWEPANPTLVFRVARLAGVPVDDVLTGTYPPPGCAPTAGTEKKTRLRSAVDDLSVLFFHLERLERKESQKWLESPRTTRPRLRTRRRFAISFTITTTVQRANKSSERCRRQEDVQGVHQARLDERVLRKANGESGQREPQRPHLSQNRRREGFELPRLDIGCEDRARHGPLDQTRLVTLRDSSSVLMQSAGRVVGGDDIIPIASVVTREGVPFRARVLDSDHDVATSQRHQRQRAQGRHVAEA